MDIAATTLIEDLLGIWTQPFGDAGAIVSEDDGVCILDHM